MIMQLKKILTFILCIIIFLSGCASYAKRIQRYLDHHPEVPEEIKQNLLTRKLVQGMNKQQVRLILGKPQEIEKHLCAFGTLEIWNYGNCISTSCSVLYFDANGQLTYFTQYKSQK